MPSVMNAVISWQSSWIGNWSYRRLPLLFFLVCHAVLSIVKANGVTLAGVRFSVRLKTCRYFRMRAFIASLQASLTIVLSGLIPFLFIILVVNSLIRPWRWVRCIHVNIFCRIVCAVCAAGIIELLDYLARYRFQHMIVDLPYVLLCVRGLGKISAAIGLLRCGRRCVGQRCELGHRERRYTHSWLVGVAGALEF